MNDARGHEPPGSEMKDSLVFITIVIARVLTFLALIPWAAVLTSDAKSPRWILHTQWVVLQERNLDVKGPESFIMGVNMPEFCFKERYYLHLLILSSALEGDIIPIFQGCSLYKYPWKCILEQKIVTCHSEDMQ